MAPPLTLTVFGPDPMVVYDDWPEFVAFASSITTGIAPLVESTLACPVPAPRQVFAIGVNYRDHAEESGMAVPDVPATFTKFPASLAGPFDDIQIVGDTIDREVELVAVIGRHADRVDLADASDAAWFDTISALVVHVDDDAETHARWFAEHDVSWALQRPDFHLYGTALDTAGARELVRDLRTQLARTPEHAE
jgi:hypothetical protein